MLAELGIDGNRFNIATLTVAVLTIFVRPLRRRLLRGRTKPCWRADKAAYDFLNGSAIVPFAVMPMTVFSKSLSDIVLSNVPTLAAAGVVGFIYVIGEVFTAGRDDDKLG